MVPNNFIAENELAHRRAEEALTTRVPQDVDVARYTRAAPDDVSPGETSRRSEMDEVMHGIQLFQLKAVHVFERDG